MKDLVCIFIPMAFVIAVVLLLPPAFWLAAKFGNAIIVPWFSYWMP